MLIKIIKGILVFTEVCQVSEKSEVADYRVADGGYF
jgi:hypothetical protein